jgi:opacity protein-like surface antigen
MNPTTRIVGCVRLALLTSSGISHAQNWADNLYLHADIGPAFVQSAPTRTRNVTESNLGGFATVQRGRFESDTEIRADLSVGYNLTKSFALEAEAGAIWNPTDKSDSYFYQIPVMLNGIYQIPLSDSWKVYVGAGAGAVISRIHGFNRDEAFHTPITVDDSDWSAGYQAEAGIKYAVSRHVDIDLGYKFLGVAQYNYRFRHVGDIIQQDITVNDLFTHSVQLSLTLRF